MTKQLLSILTICACGVAYGADYNVGTEPTAKSALIEEFTGLLCGNCPDGHARAAALQKNHPDEVFVMAVHAGHFAEVGNSTYPDFTTATGDELHDYYGANSYPCGDVSRRDFGKGVVMGRGDWYSACRTQTSEQSPVNLYAQGRISGGVLTVDVEAYFTQTMTNPHLSVMLLQNNIIGPQSGGQLGDEYPHRHMLRDRLTKAAFGDPMPEKNQGAYYSTSYTYTLPVDINGVPLVAADLEVLVYVAEGDHGQVVKAAECHPELQGDTPLTVYTSAPAIPVGKTYALDYLEMFVDNYSAQPVTTAEFEVTLGGETRTLTWNGVVAPHSHELIRIPLNGWWQSAYDADDAVKYTIRSLHANGEAVAPNIATIRGDIKALPNWPDKLTFKIKTDADAADNTYRIIDEQGNIVHEFGPYANGSADTYEATLELDPDKVYGFEIADHWGDGVYHPRGNVKVYDNQGTLVNQQMEITDWGLRTFFRTSKGAEIESVHEVATPLNTVYYDPNGRLLQSEPAHGVYIRRQSMSDGSVHVTKIIK